MSKTIKQFLTTGLAAVFLAGSAASVCAAAAEIEILQTTRVLATEAAEAGDCDETLRLLIPFAEIVREAQDVHSGRLLGWCFGATGEPQRAVAWRELVSRWTGADSDQEALAAALAEIGQQDAALIIARDLMNRNPDAARLVHDILLGRAATAMNAGKCEETLDLIGEASAIAAPTRDDRKLRAWALYDCGRYAEAGDAFEILYVELQEDNGAQGLVLNDYQAKRLDRTEAVATTHGGPLVERLPTEPLPRRRDGRVDYADVFLTGDGRISGYHRREWSGLPGIGGSTRQGEGPSELDAWRLPVLKAEYQHDRHRFEFLATRLDLKSGDMSLANFSVNAPQVTGVSITDSGSGLWEPVFTWVYESDLIWTLDIGATPIDGEVSPTVQGGLGASQSTEDYGWSLAAVRMPVEQSILSWTGVSGIVEINGNPAPLPFTWGRVTRNGLNAAGYLKISDEWTLSGDLRVGDYHGHNVVSNFGGEFYGLAERRWFGSGDSGFWSGPYLYLSGYQENLSGFAPGHGGYFSPDWLVGTGLSGRWRRGSETDPWYLEIRASGGYQKHEETAAELIPDENLRDQVLALLGLNPGDLGRFDSNTESGFAGTLEIEGLRRIGSTRWHWGGYVRARVSPEFDDFAMMLVIRYGLESQRQTVRRHYKEQFQLLDR